MPCTISVGTLMRDTRSPGPRLAKKARSAASMTAVDVLAAYAWRMCSSTDRPAVAALSRPDHPFFGVSALKRLVVSECHAIVGVIASTRQSIAAATSWMPPPYDAPAMPTRGSRGPSRSTPGCVEIQSSIASTSRPSYCALSISTVPADLPKPRGSHVNTLYPARWQRADPDRAEQIGARHVRVARGTPSRSLEHGRRGTCRRRRGRREPVDADGGRVERPHRPVARDAGHPGRRDLRVGRARRHASRRCGGGGRGRGGCRRTRGRRRRGGGGLRGRRARGERHDEDDSTDQAARVLHRCSPRMPRIRESTARSPGADCAPAGCG